VVATVLVLVSLGLVTVYFRESSGGGLHDVQGTGASVLRPFEVAAERVARPFRDAAGWVGDVVGAKNENKKLRAENEELRAKKINEAFLERENRLLRQELQFQSSPRFPSDFRPVNAQVIGRAPTEFQQTVTMAAGRNSGIRVHDPVITSHGLVGQVTYAAPGQARVTLLTDQTSAVSGLDYQTKADGIVQHGKSRESLIVDHVTKDQVVNPGDVIVTAGWSSKGFASIYPRGIPVCKVTSVNQTDTEPYKNVLCQPYVNFSSLEIVTVLVPKGRAG
jgi:rod shape-determining protein MreC